MTINDKTDDDGEQQSAGEHHHDHSHLDATALRVKALGTLLTEKGYIEPAALDELIDTYENRIGPKNGAQVVAKAWTDDNFRDWLLSDASAAIASLGFTGRQGEHMVVVENTAQVHNVVVCTLCSCYPWPVLGLPPAWYKSAPYRSRVVIEPQKVLAEFGLKPEPQQKIKVWDSTAEVRYLVLPQRPPGTDNMSESELARLVTRDSMIGTAVVASPEVAAV